MRKKKFLSNIIILFVILSIIFTGIGSYFTRYDDYIAQVNGQKIYFSEFEDIIQYLVNNETEFKIDPLKIIKNKKIKLQILNKLIDRKILNQYIDKLNIKVKDEEIKKLILYNPNFITNEKFNNLKFHNFIRKNKISTSQYANFIRNQVKIKNFFDNINSISTLFPKEYNILLKLIKQKRKVRLAKLNDIKYVNDESINKDEIEHYYIKSNNYYLPESFKVNYIIVSFEDIYRKINVSEDEMYKWYKKNQEFFKKPSRYQYSLIQSKTLKDANECLKKIKMGADFAEIAKHYSIDPISSKDGGNIGWINENELQDFIEIRQADLKEKGQISKIIKSSLGFFIFKLNNIETFKADSFYSVKENILDNLKYEKTLNEYENINYQIKKIININNNFNDLKEKLNLEVKTTDWFTLKNIPKEIRFNEIQDLLKSYNTKKNSINLINVQGSYIIVFQVCDYRTKCLQPLSKVYKKIKDTIKHEKSIQKAKLDSINILKSFQNNENEANVIKTLNISFQDPKYFNNMNLDDPITKKIFSLPKPLSKKSSYGVCKDINGNIILVALDEISEINTDENQIYKIKEKLNLKKFNQILDVILQNLRDHSTIKINKNF